MLGGFFYASYETADFIPGNRDYYAFDMQSPDVYKYNFFYDGTAGCADTSDPDENGGELPFVTKPGTAAANVFTNTTGEPVSIGAVGFSTFNNGLSYYDVTIYSDLKDPDDPCSGTDNGTTRISTVYPGCPLADGWQNIDGSCYYFNTEGYAVQGEYVQGWWLDKKSCRQVYPYMAAWHKNIRGWWYGDSSGWYAKKGTYIIDGVRYTFDAEGYLAE